MSTDFLNIAGQPIAYTTSPGDGLPALLIHGNSSSSRTFQPQLESELGRTHRLVAIDLPGFGASQPIADPEGGLGIQGYGRLVVKVVAALGLDEVVLIRRSDGRARAAIAGSIRPGGYKDEVQVTANLRVPLAVLHGAQEQLVNGAYFDAVPMPTLWRGAVHVIPGAGHAPHWETPDAFNALLANFLADCNAGMRG